MSQVLIPSTNGALYFFGTRAARDENILGLIHNQSDQQSLELYFSYNNLPVPATATSPDFIAGYGIPANSIITGAYYEVITAFAGGTSYDIGLQTVAGVEIDNDGLWNDLLTASINAVGERGVSSGALVNTAITSEGFPVVVATGTFTAGQLRLVITFLPPVSAPNE